MAEPTYQIVPRPSLARLVRACQALARAQGGPLAREADEALAELTVVNRPAPAPRAAYTIEETAKLIGRSPKTVYRLARAGELGATKLGGSWSIPSETVTALAKPAQRWPGQDDAEDSKPHPVHDTHEPTGDAA